MKSAAWFDVHKEGLAKLMANRPKSFFLFELLQNAWDEDGVTEVSATLAPVEGRPISLLTVSDDCPEGFKDLTHAFTLFAESAKKSDPGKRGRFNLGEKLVLACCEEAEIVTTRGCVSFLKDGTRSTGRRRTERGSVFTARVRMTREEHDETVAAMSALLPPKAIATSFNGRPLQPREPVASFEETLPTLLSGEDGTLRRTTRKTAVNVYEPLPGETASLYEMGIPVVPTGDRFHVEVMQKVPLNMDRDNVPPAYLQTVRTAVLNRTFDLLRKEDATEAWVQEATGDRRCEPAAVERALDLRFGERRVSYDPTDPEANKIAVSQGYVVLHGGSLSKGQWDNARAAAAVKPAGQVTPSPKPYSENGEPLKEIPEADWTDAMRRVAAYAAEVARGVLGREIRVEIANDPGLNASATYGPSGVLTLNLRHLGRRFFDAFPENATEDVDWLLIHEFAHQHSCDHLSAEFHRATCRLGAKLARMALDRPDLFPHPRRGPEAA